MKPRYFLLAALTLATLTGCDVPGRPKLENKFVESNHVTNFNILYSQNCLGCHGNGQTVASANPLNDPLYLAIVPRERFREIVAGGVPHTLMSGFSVKNGGTLTEEQVDIIVDGIYKWATQPLPADAPAYSDALGDPVRGAEVFAANCASCHGVDGHGIKGKAGSVVNAYYLDLVSDQYLRTITIAGRPDLGCPDYRSRVPGRSMTNEEIGDVVAWLVSQRKNEFGQPLVQPTQP